jgi:Holliday junction resolvase RusA-like endonuclease
MKGKGVRMYDPGTAEGWKGQIAAAIKEFMPAFPLTGAIRIDLTFYFPRPKNHYRTGKRSRELRDDAPVWHLGKPDRDNCDKAVLDALKVMGFLSDDCIVCDGRIQKRYAEGREGMLMRVTEAGI